MSLKTIPPLYYHCRGLLCDSDGLSWNLTEALRILSESSHAADNKSQQTLTVDEMTTHLLRNATQTRRQLINNITHRSRDNVQVNEPEDCNDVASY